MMAIHVGAQAYRHNPDQYDRVRPTYSAAALTAVVKWINLKSGATVADVGAGTGILSRQLSSMDLDVIAIEPVVEMADILRAKDPQARCVIAQAEKIPLAPASVDAVFCAQTWHWLDFAAAADEFRLILRPGGAVVLLWNMMDRSVGWVRRVDDLHAEFSGNVSPGRSDDSSLGIAEFLKLPYFDSDDLAATYDNPQVQSIDDFVTRMCASSYLGEMRRNQVSEFARTVTNTLMHELNASSNSPMTVPYRTLVHARKLSIR